MTSEYTNHDSVMTMAHKLTKSPELPRGITCKLNQDDQSPTRPLLDAAAQFR